MGDSWGPAGSHPAQPQHPSAPGAARAGNRRSPSSGAASGCFVPHRLFLLKRSCVDPAPSSCPMASLSGPTAAPGAPGSASTSAPSSPTGSRGDAASSRLSSSSSSSARSTSAFFLGKGSSSWSHSP
ncbi:PREDICTED: putative protein TPRXL [Tauraco erythrolophus]|uniref:putative protein TPRXL n=1 Tax=Tauraco erythrolophus TaxID=121530 RepID=UPI0005236FBE|nr:PREDICTED: putative protein TPRXL [Tauraco erythrolophus]